MKTYHMYHAESISSEGKLKEAEKQEEKQIGRGDPVFSIRMEDKHQRRSSVKKIEKMKEKVACPRLIDLCYTTPQLDSGLVTLTSNVGRRKELL